MAPLTRAGILSLVALTLHYTVLSIVLHIARSAPGPKFHASSAVWLTELFKMGVAAVLVLFTGELRPRAMEIRSWLESEAFRQEGSAEEHAPLWLEQADGGVIELGERNGTQGKENTAVEEKKLERQGSQSAPSGANGGGERNLDHTAVPIHKRRAGHEGANTPDLAIDLHPHDPPHELPGTPSLGIIPATPLLGGYSPAHEPDEGALYPDRQPLTTYPTDSVLNDLGDKAWWLALRESVFGPGVWMVGVPAFLFALQSNAQYIASGNLSVPLFQLAYQLKIPATALCSVFLLNRSLTSQQWASLFILTAGVGIVQLASSTAPHAPPPATEAAKAALAAASKAAGKAAAKAALDTRSLFSRAATTHAEAPPNQALGLAAVIFACLSSGFASTYFERMLKFPAASNAPKPSLWIRNIQLSMFGMVVGLPIVLYEMRDCLGEFGDVLYMNDGWGQAAKGVLGTAGRTFLDGFNALTWLVIFLQVTGGLLGAAVTLYADTILKCFSTSVSILISVVASVFLFNFHVTPGVAAGSFLVIFATYAYVAPQWRFRMPFRLPASMASPIQSQNNQSQS